VVPFADEMKPQTMSPQDRAYLREVLDSSAGRRWLGAVIALRPPIGGKTQEERAMSASEALGYERAVATLGNLLEDVPMPPEIKSVDIRTD
jgi:hypothetical protein